MESVQTRHIDKVFAIAARAPGAVEPGNVVHKSWARCVREHGLDPSKPSPARILPAHEVRAHQQQLDHFLRVARAGMQDLYCRVEDLGYMVLLTDAQGITVDYIGNPAWDDQLRKAGLYLGADWNEAHAGTCGVGTCLVEQLPLTCHQTEHFDATHIALTCTTAPLFDHDGKLTAILDISALRSPQPRESQHLARQLVSVYAQMIEDADFLRHFGSHWILRLGRAYGLVEVAGDVMLAFNDDGAVVGTNSGGRRAFSAAGRWSGGLAGRSLPELLGQPMDAVWRLARGASTLMWRDVAQHATLLPPRFKARPARPSGTPLRRSGTSTERPGAVPLAQLAGDDAPMQALLGKARKLVDRGIHVLIQGETGTGKELLARAFHAASARAAMPFVAVNCAAIPESLIESELFGYLPGSFTGGRSKGMKGLIAQADRGTLFLDEVGDMPLSLQTRLLRVLAEGEVLPIGGETPQRIDIAVLAATHRELKALVDAGHFREDLYYRLCGATLQLPALRERSDRRVLIERLVEQESAAQGAPAALSADALARLLAHDWPGNLRELRNVIRLALALCSGGVVRAADITLPEPAGRPPTRPGRACEADAPQQGSQTDAARLVELLQRHRWHVAAAAGELGVCRATLYRRLKRHRIVPPRWQ